MQKKPFINLSRFDGQSSAFVPTLPFHNRLKILVQQTKKNRIRAVQRMRFLYMGKYNYYSASFLSNPTKVFSFSTSNCGKARSFRTSKWVSSETI